MRSFAQAVAVLAVAACAHPAYADSKVPAGIAFANDPQTGGMTNLCVVADPYGMNFVHQANGKDFPSSLGPRFRWDSAASRWMGDRARGRSRRVPKVTG